MAIDDEQARQEPLNYASVNDTESARDEGNSLIRTLSAVPLGVVAAVAFVLAVLTLLGAVIAIIGGISDSTAANMIFYSALLIVLLLAIFGGSRQAIRCDSDGGRSFWIAFAASTAFATIWVSAMFYQDWQHGWR